MVMAVTTLLAIVGDFEVHTVRVFEEGGCVVGRRVLWIQLCVCGIDS
jgi:hypothetical protein